MRKEYPYLLYPYSNNFNDNNRKLNFLSKIDDFVNQKQYVKITLLNWQEDPLKEIAGELTSGTISKDGSSSVRQTCQLSATVSGGDYNIDDADMDFAINKKVFIEIGVKNYTKEFTDYPILWFPQGVYFISSFNINSSATSTVNISLTLKDKMCGLNGDVGGKFKSSTILDEVDTQTPTGEYISEKVLIYNIIQEVVHHFGGEDLNNIIIEDVPLRIKRVMKWTGDNPIWLIPQWTSSEATTEEDALAKGVVSYQVSLTDPTINPDETSSEISIGVPRKINYNDDAGYIYDDFYYTTELVANAGDTVTSILDKIVQYLGNYEYFYDVFGIFHFREIKNYMNTTQAKVVLDSMDKNDYLVDTTTGKNVFTFSDDKNLTSITATPSYENVKNDYVVHGTRKMSNTDISYDVFYHLCIDKKPAIGNTYYNLLFYKDKDTGIVKACFPLEVEELPQPGNFNVVYKYKNTVYSQWKDGEYKEFDGTINESVLNQYSIVEVEELPSFGFPQTLYHFSTNSNVYYYWIDGGYKEIDDNNISSIDTVATVNDLPDMTEQNKGTVYKQQKTKFYYWNNNDYKEVDSVQYISADDEGYTTKDWRTEIYMQGLLAKNNGTDSSLYYTNLQNQYLTKKMESQNDVQIIPSWKENIANQYKKNRIDTDYYFEELDAFWPQIYDIQHQYFYGEIDENKLEEKKQDYLNKKADLDKISPNYNRLKAICDDVQQKYSNQQKVVDTQKIAFELVKKDYDTAVSDLAVTDSTLDDLEKQYSEDEAELDKVMDEISKEPGGVATEEQQGRKVKYQNSLNNITKEIDAQNKVKELREQRVSEKQKTFNEQNIKYEESLTILESINKELIEAKRNLSPIEKDYKEAEKKKSEAESLYNSSKDSYYRLSQSLTDGNYFLDFIDPQSSQIGQFSVQNIGRRTDVVNDNDINCLFEPEIPDIVYLNTGDSEQPATKDGFDNLFEQNRDECLENGANFSQVKPEVYYAFSTGGYKNGAFDKIKYELYLHTNYQKSLSLTAIPCFYLEPNSRVTINDKSTNTYGSYVIKTISIPLGPGNSMSVTCSECFERNF